MNEKRFEIRLKKDLYEKLKLIAKKYGITISSLIRLILNNELQNYDKKEL